jgi:hypothetical protein
MAASQPNTLFLCGSLLTPHGEQQSLLQPGGQ